MQKALLARHVGRMHHGVMHQSCVALVLGRADSLKKNANEM